MAPGPNAAAATPQRVNPVYQEIIDKGTPILLSSPTPSQPANKRTRHLQTEPIARPDLQHAGRPHKAPHTPIGLSASTYAQSNYLHCYGFTHARPWRTRQTSQRQTLSAKAHCPLPRQHHRHLRSRAPSPGGRNYCPMPRALSWSFKP